MALTSSTSSTMRFALEIVTHEPKVPYRETITSPAEAEHRHRKRLGPDALPRIIYQFYESLR